MIFNSKKGVFFTLDAVLGLMVLIILFIFPFVYLSTVDPIYSDVYSLTLANDVATVLIESDLAKDAIIAADYTEVETYLNSSVPEQFGSKVKIVDGTGTTVVTVTGADCSFSTPYIAKRPLYANADYIVEVTLC